MTDYVFLLDAECVRHRVLNFLRILGGRPAGYFAILETGHGDGGFHGSMREERRIIFRLDNLPALGESCVHITDIACNFSGLTRSCFQSLAELIAVERSMRTVIPVDFEFLAALECSPGIVGNDGDSAERLKEMRRFESIKRDCLSYARNFQRFFVVVGFDRSTKHGWMFDGGIEHALGFRVHAESRLAGNDIVRVVEARIVFANIAPRAARIQLDVIALRNRLLGSSSGQFAEAEFAAGASVRNEVRHAHTAFARGDIPFCGGGADQHHSACGTGGAHDFKTIADGMRTVGILIAILVIAKGLFESDMVPIGAEFVRQDQG